MPRIDGCSIWLVTICDLRGRLPKTMPLIARLLLSLPPDVNMISSGEAPIALPTSAQAHSIAARALT